MQFLKRFWIAYPLAVLALVAVGYAGYWYWLADRIDKGIDAWIAAEQGAGRTVDIRARRITGFPATMHFAFEGVLFDDPVHARRLHVPALEGRMSPFELGRIDGSFTGPLAVDLGYGPAPGRYNLAAKGNGLRVEPTDNGTLTVTLDGVEVAGPPPLSHASAAKLAIRVARGTAPVNGAVGIDADTLVLPRALATPLGDTLRYLKAEIEFKDAPPPDALTSAALEAWRSAGGDMEIRSLAFGHGDADVTANGTLALDEQLQPLAAFTAKVSGFKETLDALVIAGVVEPKDAGLAKMVLGFLASKPKNGGKPELGAAVSIQDRVLSVGPVNLLRLPPIKWDEP